MGQGHICLATEVNPEADTPAQKEENGEQLAAGGLPAAERVTAQNRTTARGSEQAFWGSDPAAIEASGQAVETQIATIAIDVNLLRTDLRSVAEKSVATEKRVRTMRTELDHLKDTVATLEAKTRNLEMRVEGAEG
ncbi:hypothetical protein NDU88_004445 [Pleurodeles waltl]|uniref:Uncharacterized protein n=1 Tax=Pleurodeles waltl TaxID=8319 RepID=A0AAV7V3K8_PLEWA|nr:hypothetical protein NDU88_004445 [Pleurodeles waltl]